QEDSFPASGTSRFSDIAASSADDVWAVGAQDLDDDGSGRPLAAHWDGQEWTDEPAPEEAGELKTVEATDSGEVLAVADMPNEKSDRLYSWDGSGWSPLPEFDEAGVSLLSVTAPSSEEVWVAGAIAGDEKDSHFIQRWDGQSWSSAEIPAADGEFNWISEVDGVAADDLWAVGFTNPDKDQPVRSAVPHYLHWNGEEWRHVPTPDGQVGFIGQMTPFASDDAIAVGYASTHDDGEYRHRPTSYHWDGEAWSEVETPKPDGEYGMLWNVAPDGQGGAWTVGTDTGDGARPYFARWDGSEWSLVPAEGELADVSGLANGLTNVPGTTDMLAAGQIGDFSGAEDNLLARYSE
ncbi:MAG: hypothetical protein ACRDXX_16875, partial [Stackebrandtia sp.]